MSDLEENRATVALIVAAVSSARGDMVVASSLLLMAAAMCIAEIGDTPESWLADLDRNIRAARKARAHVRRERAH